MIVQTFTGRRGTVVRKSPPATPPDLRRVYVRLWVDVGGRSFGRPPAKVIVAYRPADVIEVRGTREETR